MTQNKNNRKSRYRIGMIIDGSSLLGQRLMTGLCRRAATYPNLLVFRHFMHVLAKEGIDDLIDRKPDALIVYCDDFPLLRKIRSALPHAPMVAMNAIPPDLADKVVAGSAQEAIGLCLDHFSGNGLSNFALFHTGNTDGFNIQGNVFRQHLENRHGTFNDFHQAMETPELLRPPSAKSLKRTGDWLRSLPKPVGVYCPVDHSASHLVRICNHLELPIPDDIQVIGCDELDETLECLPHLTSIHIPAERIGAAALITTLHLLRGEKSKLKTQVVKGASVVPLGSTGMLACQLSNIPAAVSFIESNAVLGASVDDVFQQTQTGSRTTFYHDFEKETGASPARYIRRIKLEAACQMLSTTRLNITQIAELSGFSSSNYFAQVFRRETGMKPNQYRKSNQEEA